MSLTFKLFLLSCAFVYACAIDCKDEKNNSVDWFIVYKLPQLNHTDSIVRDGVAYVYMTSEHINWSYSYTPIDSPSSILAKTLSSFHEEDSSYILYNNETPNGKNNTMKVKTKGVVSFNGYGGYWMIHTVPTFPTLGNYSFPSIAKRYGHIFICVSMQTAYINRVGGQLLHIKANVYEKLIKNNTKPLVPKIQTGSERESHHMKKQTWYKKFVKNEMKFRTHSKRKSKASVGEKPFRVEQLLSKKNQNFLSIANNGRFKKEMYTNFIAPHLKSHLMVESWPLNSRRFTSGCRKKFHVENIDSINIEAVAANFRTMDDQSIWAISSPQANSSWTCIGDIDRGVQNTRIGGGLICLNKPEVKESFQKLVGSVSSCV